MTPMVVGFSGKGRWILPDWESVGSESAAPERIGLHPTVAGFLASKFTRENATTIGCISQAPKFTPDSLPNPWKGGTFAYSLVPIRAVDSTTYESVHSLITQRSLVQIQPPQPIKSMTYDRLVAPGKSPLSPIRKSCYLLNGRRGRFRG